MFEGPKLGLVLVLGLLMAILITYFIARKIEKTFSRKYSTWVYLIISIFPAIELVGIWQRNGIRPDNLFLWFWMAYFLFCVLTFWKLKTKLLIQGDPK